MVCRAFRLCATWKLWRSGKDTQLGRDQRVNHFQRVTSCRLVFECQKRPSPSYEAFLVIYEMRNREPAEVFRINSSPEDAWQRLIPLSAFNLTGLTIQSSQS